MKREHGMCECLCVKMLCTCINGGDFWTARQTSLWLWGTRLCAREVRGEGEEGCSNGGLMVVGEAERGGEGGRTGRCT